MPVNPGRLKQRIVILRATRIHGPGGYEDTWTADRRVWANISQPTPSGAARYAQAGYSFVTHEIVLRSGPSLNLSKTRFQLDTRTFESIAPPRDTGRFITIGCRELNPSEQVIVPDPEPPVGLFPGLNTFPGPAAFPGGP